jgi:hypothetical protein
VVIVASPKRTMMCHRKSARYKNENKRGDRVTNSTRGRLITTNGRIKDMKRPAKEGEGVLTSARAAGAKGQGVCDLGEDTFEGLDVAVDVSFGSLGLE